KDRVLCKIGDFSVSNVWADLAKVKPMVSWHKLVWFSQNIPRHAFMVWLAVNYRPINKSIWSILQSIGVMDLEDLDMDMEDNEEDIFKTSWIAYY
nr:RNA-directed DNA polymerase, eukaryota, reverse transcriptase zinc-binding domain protein [Tanacetum cinerariifolium]